MSISNTVQISYMWNKDNFQRLFDSSYRYEFEHSAKRYIGWFFIALLQFAVVGALKKDSFGLLLFSSLVLLYWYYGKKIIAKRRAKKSFEKSSFKDKMINISVSEKGFEIKSDKADTAWAWSDIDEIIVQGDDIVLYKHPYFHYIPSKGFSSIEAKNNFKVMARNNDKLRG